MAAPSFTREQLIEIKTGCVAFVPGLGTSYGYVPSFAAGVTFAALFALSMVAHFIQAFRTRQAMYWLCGTGALVELLGWAGRTWSAKCPYNNNAFLMQITTLIIAPTFFAATAYVLLGQLIYHSRTASSIVSPKLYIKVFVTCDVISLVVQAVGGALASIAAGKIDGDTDPGTHTMVAGVVFQLASMSLFVVLLLDFVWRTRNDESSLPRRKYMVAAILFSIALIYIRSIYRAIELAEGWTGYLITHERYFIALDSAMMILAVAVYNLPVIFPIEISYARTASENGGFLMVPDTIELPGRGSAVTTAELEKTPRESDRS